MTEKAAHIAQLVAELDVEHYLQRPDADASHANAAQRWIETPPIDTPEVYLRALHELGHIVDGPRKTPRWPGIAESETLMREGFAWNWALDHHIGEVTPEVAAFHRACLHTYGQAAIDPLPPQYVEADRRLAELSAGLEPVLERPYA
jgi:hypothetical protein